MARTRTDRRTRVASYRSTWRGAITFGLVSIPVRLYKGTSAASVSFRLLCPDDHQPIKQKRMCPVEDKEIGWNDCARGYEVGKDQYVVISDEELEQLPLDTIHVCDIGAFVPADEVTSVAHKDAYYVEPEPVGAHPYALLQAVLADTGRIAIGKVALRDRETLCQLSINPDGGLLLTTLFWPDEIRNAGELGLPSLDDVSAAELKMARQLMQSMPQHFDPSRYHDDYREAVERLVQAKIAGQEPVKAVPPPAATQDLMASLKASLDANKKKRGAA